MNVPKILYWISTVLVAALFTFSAKMAIEATPGYMEMWKGFGYPDYLPAIMGPLKVLAVIGLLIPRTTFLKHWVYAGLAFDLMLAILAHNALGHDLTLQIVGTVLLFTSYFLYMNKMEFKELI